MQSLPQYYWLVHSLERALHAGILTSNVLCVDWLQFFPTLNAQERVLAGDDVNFVSLRWSWLAAVKPQGAATSVATWRVVLFSHHDTASMSGRNALVVDEDDTVRALAGSLA